MEGYHQQAPKRRPMHQEIERKYLVCGEDYKALATQVYHIRQGYLCRDAERTIRIRQRVETSSQGVSLSNEAFLTIKGKPQEGMIGHFEYEHNVPQSAADGLFALCKPGIIDKHRYIVPHDEVIIEVDLFHGENEGLVMAEIELQSEDQHVALPAWLGEEVTHDERYYNAYLSQHPYKNWE